MPNDAPMPTVHVLILATSLKPDSHSSRLARRAQERLTECGLRAELLPLSELGLPLCKGTKDDEEHGGVERLQRAIRACTHLLIASPVYNYDLNAAAKTAMELAGGALTGKTVGFLCAAGGRGAYMSVMSFANSLMLDFRCWIVPRFVYAVPDEFDGAKIAQPVLDRIDRLLEEMLERIPASRTPS